MRHQQRPFQVEVRRPGERRPIRLKDNKPKRWSHQDELTSLIGKEIALVFVNGTGSVVGLLTNADAFTLQLVLRNKSIRTYFKHAIAEYAEHASS
jgi:hypothetical protein